MSNPLLQRTIRDMIKQHAFIGHLVQEMHIRMTEEVPTAGIYYDKKTMKFNIVASPKFFNILEPEQRVAVFLHELMHFEKGHLFRFERLGNEKEHTLKNIAADMAINQYIKNLPDGCDQCDPAQKVPCKNTKCPGKCVNVKDWKQKDGTPFPVFSTTETYFDLLKQTTNPPQEQDGEGNSGKGQGKGSSINHDQFKKYKPFDKHDWEELTEEEKRQLLNEAKKMAERAIDKTFKDHSLIPGSIKDFISEIDMQLKKLNYKAIFKYAVKKNMTSPDRVSTWVRPNKRYAEYAPGNTTDRMPFMNMYMDTSGSFTYNEINQSIKMINALLGEGQMKKCNLGLWHTSLYSFKKYKKGSLFKESEIESGGTDPREVFDHIKKNNPNLSIIFTDGYYSKEDIKLSNRIIFIISDGGQVDHPYKDIGLTFKMEQLK